MRDNTVVLFIAELVYPNDTILALIALECYFRIHITIFIKSHKNRACK